MLIVVGALLAFVCNVVRMAILVCAGTTKGTESIEDLARSSRRDDFDSLSFRIVDRGRTMKRDNGIQMLAMNGVNLPIRSYRFDDRGVPLHVFYCYWDARSSYESVAAESEDWSPRGRLRSALQGKRDIGAQMLEIIVWGYQDDTEAHEALARELGQVIRTS